MYDFIIVGQGIAGSLLAWFLHKAGKSLLLIDDASTISPSRVTSGIINPVTGRRLVKTWLADELLPFAEKTYRELEETLGQQLYEPMALVRLFNSVKAQNDWSVRCADKDYAPYLDHDEVIRLDPEKINNPLGGFLIKGMAHVNVPLLLSALHTFFRQQQQLVQERLTFSDLELTEECVVYKNARAKQIIFCEGVMAMQNPYFENLPFQPAKGECLLVEIKDFPFPFAIKGEVTLLPFYEEHVYYVGATHDHDFADALPCEKGKTELLRGLNNILRMPYKLLDQWAAVRPAVKDRRPLIGSHRQQKNLCIFNGMGTKGVSLSPYFAAHFAQYLLHRTPLMPEVDIRRFDVAR